MPTVGSMAHLSDTYNCGLRMCRECRERFPRHRLQKKQLVSDSGMHHDTCVTHVPWCMLKSPTQGRGENVTGIPGVCATRNLRIWQETHDGKFQTPVPSDIAIESSFCCYCQMRPNLKHYSVTAGYNQLHWHIQIFHNLSTWCAVSFFAILSLQKFISNNPI